ncbi:ThiF family adenylyltransferase [Turneriella parva]|uniref:UBA/THIF-type NAD/FAD binding protein n=1 Tax=Turneriella parva (strain ATCC BAA-1111 / DSM 21527 / NCTC 11395 / H) TaxID=869212 RepID=I4B0A0_TURPD|nr:ThiF family adenylyltransferase [Turneriella parva]AFM10707.1 UBA/THIF-type NAD/FAD binding protein [Turneriella parva DSM 21527]
MTISQDTAISELKQIRRFTRKGHFEFEIERLADDKALIIRFQLRIGLLQTQNGGLKFCEVEEFLLRIPADYPFVYPEVCVAHKRFAGFPHVTWAHWICLYQSRSDWNPYDGMFGLVDRLCIWIERAAINNMDPMEGPLEPPHASQNQQLLPFVIRPNAPVNAGEFWFGLAALEVRDSYVDLVNWIAPEVGTLPEKVALAVFLPCSMPIEFPTRGKSLFAEFERQGILKDEILRWLGLNAKLASDKEGTYLILGTPMRRNENGQLLQHISVWHIEAEQTEGLGLQVSDEKDTHELAELRTKLGDSIYEMLSAAKVSWCRVLEDRSEILVRRDRSSNLHWFFGKRVLLVGCGAIGSWSAEIIIRAQPRSIKLVDNSIVKPGVLVRQNFSQSDIGMNKAKALMKRLKSVSTKTDIEAADVEGFNFIMSDLSQLLDYDIIIDCTASNIFQMRLESAWPAIRANIKSLLSFAIDADAQHVIGVSIGKLHLGGIYDTYKQLKYILCSDGRRNNIANSFYAADVRNHLFQPEPGCSEPTFSGSCGDIQALTAAALNIGISTLALPNTARGFAFSRHLNSDEQPFLETIDFPPAFEQLTGHLTVRILPKVFTEVATAIKENASLRSPDHETGGLLWGQWDHILGIIWILDASGPPTDSKHDALHFQCGILGTVEEHRSRISQSKGLSGFIGHWHTHPNSVSEQSSIDQLSMANLITAIDENQKRAIMLIFGKDAGQHTIGIYPYESLIATDSIDWVVNASAQMQFPAGFL